MANQNSRLRVGSRDIVLTLLAFAVLCLFIAWGAGSCSFRPNGPSVGEIPRYNAEVALGAQARQVDFPLRLPATPEGWTTNSGGTEEAVNSDGGKLVNVGYYIPKPMGYLRLTQSNLPADMLVQYASDGVRTVTGEEVIGNVTWAVFTGPGVEMVWVAQLPDSSVSIYGSGTPEGFAEMARAFDKAKPLPTV